MYKKLAQLLMYGDLDQDSILYQMGEIFRKFDQGACEKEELIRQINTQMKHLLQTATDYGFDGNLWQDYLTWFLLMNENPFSLTCEKAGPGDGSVNELVRNDFRIFRELFDYDFHPIEEELGLSCFSMICNYKAIRKTEKMYNRNVSEKVRALSGRLAAAADENEFFTLVTDAYREQGVGLFGLNKAFRLDENVSDRLVFRPINNMDTVLLDDLVGYEIQKAKLIENTEAFVKGRRANNVLLFGDSGTGKSTSVKAIANQYYDQGLRMIEIYKHQFRDLSAIIAQIKNRNYRFIIYMDDLSFEEHEVEYKFLKAVIEGGVETRPENILIYATSNRRHLIRESWNDRNDEDYQNDKHHSDTVEEKLSLFSRFGVTIGYMRPTTKEYYEIVYALARRAGITTSEEELKKEANKWELAHGGLSGRTAQQFINYLLAGQE